MTTKAKSKAKKEKIKILGKSYKVDVPVKNTLINLLIIHKTLLNGLL